MTATKRFGNKNLQSFPRRKYYEYDRTGAVAGCRGTAGAAHCVSHGVPGLALPATLAAGPIAAKVRPTDKKGMFENDPQANVRDIAHAAFRCGVINTEEYAALKRCDELRDIVIHVDDFLFDYGVAAAPERIAAWQEKSGSSELQRTRSPQRKANGF